jgi:hypothetical protein
MKKTPLLNPCEDRGSEVLLDYRKAHMSKKLFVLKLRDGLLLGNEFENAPCKQCISNWLTERKIFHEFLAEVPPNNTRIIEVLETNDKPGLFFEVTTNENSTNDTRMECRLEKHKDCNCNASGYVEYPGKTLNYAFSSILKMQCTRYTSPTGSIWLATASHVDGRTVNAIDFEREKARRKATEMLERKTPSKLELIQKEVLGTYSEKNKQPMLVVGAATWMRGVVPFFLLQQFDIHVFFYPNSAPAWVAGVVAISKVNPKAKPVWSYSAGQSSSDALKYALLGLIPLTLEGVVVEEQNEKLAVWFQKWVYACPKIALKDILHFEPYPTETLELYVPAEKPAAVKPVFRLIKGGREAA